MIDEKVLVTADHLWQVRRLGNTGLELTGARSVNANWHEDIRCFFFFIKTLRFFRIMICIFYYLVKKKKKYLRMVPNNVHTIT